jgi:hypothetical protein
MGGGRVGKKKKKEEKEKGLPRSKTMNQLTLRVLAQVHRFRMVHDQSILSRLRRIVQVFVGPDPFLF